MSDGPRITLATAQRIIEFLTPLWGLRTGGALVVGSIRRQRAEVGDIEIVAPLPSGAKPEHDPLFRLLNATMANPWQDLAAGLFAHPDESLAGPRPIPIIGRALRGLKPGFAAASLVLTPKNGTELACQIYRYTPANRGWVTLMRTGPGDFGKWFLGKWKQRHGIRPENQASVDGHLVDGGGRVVRVETEEQCFALAGLAFQTPEEREAFGRTLQLSRQESMR